mgnify:CR=1 FL=1
MKTYLFPSIRLTFVLLVICSGIYPLLVAGIGFFAPGNGSGVKTDVRNLTVGYENIGQRFDRADYFQGRPSAVNYNAAGSGGSNKGPSNPDYLAQVQARIDTFLVHNPGVQKSDIPVDLVTASGSGLDPDISVQAARIQVPRIAKVRNRNEYELYAIIDKVKDKPLFGFLGPEKVNVLLLNIQLNVK